VSLLEKSAPRVFTIPPSARFLDVLAAQLWAVADGDPLRLALAAQGAGGGALIAPSIRPLGDLDADEPPFEPAGPSLEAPPAVSEARRLFELARLVEAKMRAEKRARDPAAALAAAREIARVIDEIETSEITDLSGLAGDIRARLPAHLQDAAVFLEIVQNAWPARLEELGAMDAAARRALLLRMLADQWRAMPPTGPIIAAGSTGTAPAVAHLLSVIARLPQGAVILPGLDRDLDEESWRAIDDQHPQAQLQRLLRDLRVERADVADLPGAAEAREARPRRRLIAQALLPAEASGGMLEGARAIAAAQSMAPEAFARAALDGMSLIEARGEEDEALSCALAIREALDAEAGVDTVMLVTPDTALAARISARLSRWGIEAQSSAGRPLAETAPAAFLSLLLDLAREPDATLTLCALWKHPLCTLGRTRPELRREAADLERRFLRGPRPADIRAKILGDAHLDETRRARLLRLIDDTRAALAPLTALDGERGAPERAGALAESAELFAATPDQKGAARVWAGEGGEGAATLLAELIADGEALPPLDAHDFARLFGEAMQGRAVRPRAGEHPRVRILGPLEARLQSADLVILAGLNEGVWPRAQTGEPFLSRPMRAAIGLDSPERRIGQAAHDFAQLAGAGPVILSRSRRRDGAPAVASRFLWRLKTLSAGALACAPEIAIAPHPAATLARALDHVAAQDARPAARPSPRPPVSARPRRISATSLRLLVRDPYSIYARDILALELLDPVDMAPGAAERGTAIHAALESCFDALAGEGAEHALAELTARGEAALNSCGLGPEQLAFALPRFRRAARWLAALEADRRAQGWRPAARETKAEWTIDAPAGPFTFVAKADRLDRRGADSAIVDYKTGSAPSRDEVRAGFDLQMPVQAAMLRDGAFAGMPKGAPSSLLYLRLGGGAEPGAEIELTDEDWSGERYAAFAEAVVRRLAQFFDDEANPYLSQPRAKFRNDWGDYDHLARRGEWARAGGDEE
jgi:ATP-dependent helicase/nuclease subunit B